MAFALGSEEPLPADEAFQFAAELKDARTVLLSWDIAEGYYLYRQKIRFVSLTPGSDTGTPALPPGQIKQDPVFGNVDIYREQLALELPIDYSTQTPDKLTLEISYQGCADSGFCYMPIKKILTFELDD